MTSLPQAPTRDEHLFSPGPKRMLALDGGGVRGIISVAFLERLEALLARRHPDPETFRLCDYFDLIGGTSTGAIIAAGLALGMKVAEIRRFYLDLAPRVFRQGWFRIVGVQPLFDARRLTEEISRQVGDRALDSPDLRTGLVIVTKRMDTGSPWILSNVPGTAYWDTPSDGAFLGNRHYRLANLLRASTAAPYYFQPEPIPVIDGQPPGWFVDGGVSPYNNPALALLQVATLRAHGLRWKTGEDNLLLMSIGTGCQRTRVPPDKVGRLSSVGLAVRALGAVIEDGQALAVALLQALSRPIDPWHINSEIGGLEDDCLGGQPLLSFQRFDVRFDPGWIATHTGLTVSDRDLEGLERFDYPPIVPLADRIGRAAAARLVREDHFPPAFDTPATVRPATADPPPPQR
ncbi:patatin-like phospholipase family protein [uncultured Rhodospira sp.]|uniref:patatin-like phospholipase family protein n=1 Tax=uncultured Rhodospira sp. TaxID=1936189 RepID=UPI00261FA4B0|nr:patatin-like phospholipase family protein [uncultured Rhodospira sp.]